MNRTIQRNAQPALSYPRVHDSRPDALSHWQLTKRVEPGQEGIS
jgi:hypothetical protein